MKKVLVIEDDEPLCWLLGRILRGKYEVIIMNNGMEAWSWLTDGRNCDLIISDLNMPSLNGLELLDNLSNSGLFRNIPVIILSGYDNMRNRCLELGAFNYFVKPFEPRQLLHEADRALTYAKENIFV